LFNTTRVIFWYLEVDFLRDQPLSEKRRAVILPFAKYPLRQFHAQALNAVVSVQKKIIVRYRDKGRVPPLVADTAKGGFFEPGQRRRP
jgi:hypothetical protein